MINVIIISINVIFLVFLIFGLVLSKKYSFKAGFYFFLILIVHHTLSYIYSPLVHKYIDYSLTSGNIPFGMSIGELVAWFTLLPGIIEVTAYSILVVGLYRMWKSKTVKS